MSKPQRKTLFGRRFKMKKDMNKADLKNTKGGICIPTDQIQNRARGDISRLQTITNGQLQLMGTVARLTGNVTPTF
jgi:hypothetical protein